MSSFVGSEKIPFRVRLRAARAALQGRPVILGVEFVEHVTIGAATIGCMVAHTDFAAGMATEADGPYVEVGGYMFPDPGDINP